jgi:hypothetical protein
MQRVSLTNSSEPDSNAVHMPALQIPSEFNGPDWIPALRKAGATPLLPAGLGYDLEGAAGMWKLALCLLLGALGGEVDPKLVAVEAKAVLARSGVAVSSVDRENGEDLVGRLGGVVGNVVAEFFKGKLDGVEGIAGDAAEAGKVLTKLGGPIDKPKKEVQRTLEVEVERPKVVVPSLRPVPQPSRPAPAPEVHNSVSDDPLDFLLPSVALPSLNLGGARALLSSCSTAGAFEFPPTPPRAVGPTPAGKQKDKEEDRPTVKREVKSALKTRSPGQTVGPPLRTTNTVRLEPPRSTSSFSRSATSSTSSTRMPAVAKPPGTASKTKKGGFEKLCDQIVGMSANSSAKSAKPRAPIHIPSLKAPPKYTASSSRHASGFFGEDDDLLIGANPNLFSKTAEIPRTPIGKSPVVTFAESVVTPKAGSSSKKKAATPGSAKIQSGLRTRVWPPPSVEPSPEKRDDFSEPAQVARKGPENAQPARNEAARTLNRTPGKLGSPARVQRAASPMASASRVLLKNERQTPGGGTVRVERG